MCNSYRLHVPVNVIGDVFSQAGRPLHFPDGQPNLPATDDIRIGDRAAVVRPDDATPQLTMTPWAWKGPGGPRVQLPLGRTTVRWIDTLSGPGRRP